LTGIAVLGSTGSIGRQTIEVIERHRDRFSLVAIGAGHPSPVLQEQMERWPAATVWTSVGRPTGIGSERWAAGGLEELAGHPEAKIVVVATTGMTALRAVLAALDSGRRVALANKETLVVGGHLVTALLDRLGGDPLDRLRPIDSEHSAIWQCLLGEDRDAVAGLILTASGGPFIDRSPGELEAVTAEEALAHPTWRMGPKITVDSATLVNKAFEAIEARWLYRLPYDRIRAVIHPQSVVHSLVEFIDGSYKAQLGLPDMRLPIQFALSYPHRVPPITAGAGPESWGSLTFAPLEPGRFPAYDAVRRAAELGGNHGTILNAADEVAVEAFLAGTIPFPRIAETIESAVDRWGARAEPDLVDIAALDAEIRAALSVELSIGGVA